MDEEWRRKQYYKPRVLIETDRVLNPQYQDSLLCITGEQLEMLRNLTQYLRRRSTFVSSYSDTYYLAPSNEEWNSLQAIVSELEETLMGCQDIVAQLKCICDALTQLRTKDALPVDSALPDQPLYDNYRSDVEEEEGDPPEGFPTWSDWKTAKCKGAQKVMDDVVTFMEQLIVWSGAGTTLTFVVLESALVASTVVPPLAIVITIAALIATVGLSLIQQAAQDWIAEHKQCLVCAIFEASTAAEARANLEEYVAAEWDIVGSSAVFMHLLNFSVLSHIFDGTMAEYDEWESQYQAAYCSLCVTKVVGNDWWALPLSPAANTLELDLVGGGLTGGCWQGFLPSGEVWCGVVYTVQNMTGPDVHLKCMSGGEAGCEGYSLWGNTSGHKPEDTYFAVDGQYIDEVNCKATLAPGATNGPTVNRHQNGQEAGAGFFFQASGTAHVEIVFEYLIFEGVEPPCE